MVMGRRCQRVICFLREELRFVFSLSLTHIHTHAPRMPLQVGRRVPWESVKQLGAQERGAVVVVAHHISSFSSHRHSQACISWLPWSCWESDVGPLWAAALNGWGETLQNCLLSAAVLVGVCVNRKLHRLGSWREQEAAPCSHRTGHTAGERTRPLPV